MSKFIFEIFSEELPATLQKSIAIDYKQFLDKELNNLKVDFHVEKLFVGITLNRLVLILEDCNVNKEQAIKLVEDVLKDFSKTFPRTMCYPQLEVRWLRPIRSLFACIDNDVLQGNVFGVDLKNGTYTQKFNFHECGSCEEYEQVLKNEEIEIDYNRRLEFVKAEIFKENQEYKNAKLAEEIAGMSEYCITPMKSLLDAKFNVLPFELIELVLRENQRYVVFKPDERGNIYFLIFGDKITKSIEKRETIIEGHRKVVNARLEDALYYWKLDEKIKDNIKQLREILSGRTFIDNILWGDYLYNQEILCSKIVNNNEDLKLNINELIWNTKLDLATGVVAEFPELQGIIGSYYFGYDFNPYVLDEENVNIKNASILCYYFIDRMVYIQKMYNLGKQPTGSGDKYKVKVRMDDILTVLRLFEQNNFNDLIDTEILLSILMENTEIYKLFVKRYQKYIEDSFKKDKNVKKFADVCAKLLENSNFKMFLNISEKLNLLNDNQFIKTYKRIIGYTSNINFEENENILKKVNEILPNKNSLVNINEYLDNNKIADSLIIKQALKYIEDKYFSSKLEVEFLSIV